MGLPAVTGADFQIAYTTRFPQMSGADTFVSTVDGERYLLQTPPSGDETNTRFVLADSASSLALELSVVDDQLLAPSGAALRFMASNSQKPTLPLQQIEVAGVTHDLFEVGSAKEEILQVMRDSFQFIPLFESASTYAMRPKTWEKVGAKLTVLKTGSDLVAVWQSPDSLEPASRVPISDHLQAEDATVLFLPFGYALIEEIEPGKQKINFVKVQVDGALQDDRLPETSHTISCIIQGQIPSGTSDDCWTYDELVKLTKNLRNDPRLIGELISLVQDTPKNRTFLKKAGAAYGLLRELALPELKEFYLNEFRNCDHESFVRFGFGKTLHNIDDPEITAELFSALHNHGTSEQDLLLSALGKTLSDQQFDALVSWFETSESGLRFAIFRTIIACTNVKKGPWLLQIVDRNDVQVSVRMIALEIIIKELGSSALAQIISTCKTFGPEFFYRKGVGEILGQITTEENYDEIFALFKKLHKKMQKKHARDLKKASKKTNDTSSFRNTQFNDQEAFKENLTAFLMQSPGTKARDFLLYSFNKHYRRLTPNSDSKEKMTIDHKDAFAKLKEMPDHDGEFVKILEYVATLYGVSTEMMFEYTLANARHRPEIALEKCVWGLVHENGHEDPRWGKRFLEGLLAIGTAEAHAHILKFKPYEVHCNEYALGRGLSASNIHELEYATVHALLRIGTAEALKEVLNRLNRGVFAQSFFKRRELLRALADACHKLPPQNVIRMFKAVARAKAKQRIPRYV